MVLSRYPSSMTGSEALDTLNRGFVHTIKDPLWGNIPVTGGLRNLIATDEVEKLSGIKQNGPAFHIYPGAVHTRLGHSLGVYYLGREILLSLARKKRELPFTAEGMMSFLSACILHDIGHFPYAHSLKELAIKEHEEIAAELILGGKELGDAVEAAVGNRMRTALIIADGRVCDDPETLIYRRILSGTLDPDKLDYLTRDAFFAGIPYGKQDTDFIISSMDIEDGRIVLDHEAISSVEQVLFSKYMMYRALYWHKGVRSLTAMIKKAVVSALKDGVITYDDLYLKDDYDFYNLSRKHPDYPPFTLIALAEKGRAYPRKAAKPFDENGVLERRALDIMKRSDVEDEIWSMLKERHPSLQRHEVIIDIPERISFETDIGIRMEDGRIIEASDAGMLFPKAGTLFSSSLRTVSLFLPQYIPAEDAAAAFRMADHE